MNILTKTTLLESNANVLIENWLYHNPKAFKAIYNIDYAEDGINSKNEISSVSRITNTPEKQLILFGLDTGKILWENRTEHKLRKKFLKQFKNLGLNFKYVCGYINGLQSPAPQTIYLSSANNFNGYEFWQKVIIENNPNA